MNYVPSSVEGLQEKLDAAKTVLEQRDDQAEIDEAEDAGARPPRMIVRGGIWALL